MIAIPDSPSTRERGAPAEGVYLSVGVAMPSNEGKIGALHVVATGVALVAAATGVNFASGNAMALCCGAILLLGLPHGALDMVALLHAGRARVRAIIFYLALAGAMAAFWWVVPGVALLVFFAIAIGHFGEDWPGPGMIAHGAALALLAAPLLFHRGAIDALFAIIAGPAAIPPLADSLLLVAPVALGAGLTACALLWSAGRPMLAASSAAALAGMVLLPPLAGFALSFGLFHSPRQFARGLTALGSGRAWIGPVASASAAAALLVVTIVWSGSAQPISAGIVRATFIVLSVLTVPHMLLPLILRSARLGVIMR